MSCPAGRTYYNCCPAGRTCIDCCPALGPFCRNACIHTSPDYAHDSNSHRSLTPPRYPLPPHLRQRSDGSRESDFLNSLTEPGGMSVDLARKAECCQTSPSAGGEFFGGDGTHWPTIVQVRVKSREARFVRVLCFDRVHGRTSSVTASTETFQIQVAAESNALHCVLLRRDNDLAAAGWLCGDDVSDQWPCAFTAVSDYSARRNLGTRRVGSQSESLSYCAREQTGRCD
jgi:hypothetical protein